MTVDAMRTRQDAKRVTRTSSPRTKKTTCPPRSKHKKPKRVSKSNQFIAGSKSIKTEMGEIDCFQIKREKNASPLLVAHGNNSPNENISEDNVKREARSPPPDATAVEPTGFARDRKVKQIVGICEGDGGRLYFGVEWQGVDTLEYVPAEEANRHCPQDVIRFYERRCFFAVESRELPETSSAQ